MTTRRHQWGPPATFRYKTERACVRDGCGLIKVTRHESGAVPPHWREWWRHGDRVMCEATPPCVEAGEVAACPLSRLSTGWNHSVRS